MHYTLHCSTHHHLIIRHSETDPRIGWSPGRDSERNTVILLHGIAGCVACSISGVVTAETAECSIAGGISYKEQFLYWNMYHTALHSLG